MELALVLFLLSASVYTALYRPAWFWVTFIGGPAVLDTLALFGAASPSAISAGSLTLRSFDPGLLAIVVGVMYHCRRTGLKTIRQQPGGTILLLILLFIVAKVAISVLFFSDVILQNHTASHSLGGLVAAMGETRDNLFFLLPPLYAYAVPESRDLKALSRPLFFTLLALIVFWVIGCVDKGNIWTGSLRNQFARPIPATIAIDLTQFGFLFLLLPVRGLRPFLSRAVAVIAILAATSANHRSQWMALFVAGGVLLAVAMFGRPIVKTKTAPVLVSGAVLLLGCAVTVLISLASSASQTPFERDMSVRLYAFTDPSHDADAKWREALWTDRVGKVGSNWPWGRVIGDRPETLFGGIWVTAPDHSAYVASYEMGGALFCGLLLLFFGRLIVAEMRLLLRERSPDRLWPAGLALSLTCSSIAFGTAYDFPPVALGLIVILLCQRTAEAPVRGALVSRQRRGTGLPSPSGGPQGTPALG